MKIPHIEIPSKYAQIGARVRRIREKTGISQKEFGKKLGVKNSTVSEIERGNTRPTETILIAIEHVFGYPRSWVLYGEGSDTMPPKEILLEAPRGIVQSIKGSGNMQAAGDIHGPSGAEAREEQTEWESAAPSGGGMVELIDLLKDYGTPKMIDDLRDKLLKIKKMVEGE